MTMLPAKQPRDSLAKLAAMRRASSRVRSFAAARRPEGIRQRAIAAVEATLIKCG